MISFLRGRLDSVDDSYAYIDCAGVGYRAMMPSFDIANVGDVGEEVRIYTHLHVTENEMSLYGFNSSKEKGLFELLISVNGIGPKAGIAILSELTYEEVCQAIITSDSKALSSAKGVGKKTAERVILELNGKIDAAEFISKETPVNNDISYKSEVIMALEALGYSRSEANAAIRQANYEEGMSEEQFLKECLKTMI